MANKIVEKSRKEAESKRYLEKNRILKVEKTEIYMSRDCECCGAREDTMMEIKIGHGGSSRVFVLCSECLSKLGEIIWEV